MMMVLHHYPIQLIYEPGKNLIVADTLSRAPVLVENEERNNLSKKEVNCFKAIASVKLFDNVKISSDR